MRYILVAITLVACSRSAAQNKEAILLESVWAYRMPGTKDVRGLSLAPFDGDEFPGWGFEEFSRTRDQAIETIARALQGKPSAAEAQPGFVVPDHLDAQSMRRQSQVIARAIEGKQPDFLPHEGKNVTVCFFSHPSSYYVRLADIERDGNVIEVQYQFVPHKTCESTVHFAFIPLGPLAAGEYEVRFQQIPMEKSFREDGFMRPSFEQIGRLICQSFTFQVKGSFQAADFGEAIPLDSVWALQMPGTSDVRKLNADEAKRIRVGLTLGTANRKVAGPCFLVKGEGEEALNRAAEYLADKKTPEPVVAGDAASLVFYSYSAPGYVHIKSVDRTSEHVTINYQVVIHLTSEATVHFALIPLRTLSAGNLRVEIVEQVGDTPVPYPKVKERAICDSCSFVIQHGG